MDISNVETVAIGAVYCRCGGMMQCDQSGGYLMSNPPQQKIICPFCGNTETVLAPYNISIQFKRK